MDAHIFLLQLVIILFTARLGGELLSFFKAPSVIGEMIAGIIIGPSVMGWIDITAPIHLLAQIGIILLLFEVGLETDVNRLKASGMKATLAATVGVIMPFIGGFWVSYSLFNLSLLASLFIGSTLTATSIGITLRVLKDLNHHKSKEAQVIIGAAVLDDIIGIVILSVLFEFASHGGVNLFNLGKIILFIALFFLIAPFAAKCIAHTIMKWDEKSSIPGLLPTTIVSMILFFAWLAHALGAPELLGGFAAGLALSRQFFLPFATILHHSQSFSDRLEKQMKPIIHLFTPIFFVAIGLSLDLKAVNWSSSFIWILTSSLLLVAVIGKMLSGFVLWKESTLSKFIIGTAMVPRGEVGLIFANVGLSVSAISSDVYASLIVVITLTTLLIPFVLKYIYKNFERKWIFKF